VASASLIPNPSIPVFYSLNPAPDACASDQADFQVLCVSFGSANVNLVDFSMMPPAVTHSDLTGSVGGSIQTSGGPCTVCGLVYDRADDAFILSDANGYQLFSRTSLNGGGTPAPMKTIAAFVAENFGYNPQTNQIFSPEELGNRIDLIDVGSGRVYGLAATDGSTPYPSDLDEPDAGSVDLGTNIGLTANEFPTPGSNPVILVPLNGATLNSPSPGQFIDPNIAEVNLASSLTNSCSGYSKMVNQHAIDSASHLAFLSTEFCGPSSSGGQATVGVAVLPSSGSGPVAISDYVFAPVPQTPDGMPWTSSGDPHGIAIMATSAQASTGSFGVLEDFSRTYIALVDLKALLAQKRSAADAQLVDSSVDLVASGVVTFFSMCGLQRTQPQPRAVELGVSGGNIGSVNGICCSGGTLGSLLQDSSGTQYILSNNHVLVAGGSSTIVQPGLVDTTPVCTSDTAAAVANLSGFVPISGTTSNSADAAIASVIIGDVDTSGSIANIGPISSNFVTEPMPGLPVQKMGRTSCLTQGQLEMLNTTITVTYDECNASLPGAATFTNQLVFGPPGFSDKGDSGSLIVTRETCPRPVALLFAGGESMTFGNPIGNVLNALGSATGLSLSFVGTCGTSPSARAWAEGEPFLPNMPTSRDALTAAIKGAAKVRGRHEHDILKVPGVTGIGVGVDSKNGNATVVILVEKDTRAVRALLPLTLEGVSVRVKQSGVIHPLTRVIREDYSRTAPRRSECHR